MLIFKEFTLVLFISLSIAFLNLKVFIYNISIFLLLGLFFHFFFKSKASRRGELVLQHKGEKLKILNSTLKSIKSIKISLAESFAYKIFNKHYEQEERHRRWSGIISQFPRLFFEVLAIVLICSITIFYTSYENSKVDFLSFITFFSICIIRVIPSISIIVSSMNVIIFKNSGASLVSNHISKFYSKPESEKTIIRNRENLISTVEKITLRNISFSYKKKLIFDKFNFTFEKNKIYGIVGKSGSGKSTLLDLITSLIKPNSGQIIVNDKYELDQVKLDLRSKTGYVPQRIHLFDDTLRNNITLAEQDNDASLDVVLNQYINKLDLFEEVNNLSNKLDMNIANEGSNLSGGQAQRIGLIRALYKNPDIIILDEFTSSLDNKNEVKILKHIYSLKLNKIIIIISHSVEPLKICDEIINLDNFYK
jgi:ABC-type multidrug transport system fused ATPase/permease subunit